MNTRKSTDEELLAHLGFYIRQGWTIRFRHFLQERHAPRARNGVAHVQYSRAKVVLVDGAPHVRHHGKLQRITATTLLGDRPVVYDVRLDSPHLT